MSARSQRAAPLRIVDAHHHLWDPAEGRHPWMRAGVTKFMGDTAPVCHRYEVQDLQAEARAAEPVPIELLGSVHLQCGRNPQDPVEESAWVQQQADRSGLPIAIVGYASLADPQLDALLARHAAAAPGFRGVRQMLNWGDQDRMRLCERGDWLSDAAWQRGFALLGERGLSFDLQVNPWQLTAAARVAERHPGTAVVVNHAGLPFDYRGQGLIEWQNGMRHLAALPSVSVKFSGLGMVDPHWSAASVRRVFDFLLAHFGVARMMFASNFPIDRLYRSYGQVFQSYGELCAGLDPTAREALFSGTASRVYRLDTGAPAQ
ncbi:amidohydrolase family protein [Variovorax boronicumulans]|uniref:amidohydrolase family protein n=1 Tax=Variovorax boronicumulans TaxID=436515 RepID=UPI001C5768E3